MTSMSIQILGENAATAWSRWTYVVLGSDGNRHRPLRGTEEDTLVRERAGVWKFKRRQALAAAKQP